ncbi:hypothetical protein GBAR_LOCUS15505 [Geodia barretti]|uniref:Uncharacterized protein n=1 Tax=Geodia barretti TaxID=519541 RepID=A0AA35WUJ2_GEOBA|nr:hypothetical protein GBAR_LOCUS15505 [Geodia barretti]
MSVQAAGEPLATSSQIQRGEAVSINSSQDVMSFRERKRKTGCTRNSRSLLCSSPQRERDTLKQARAPPREKGSRPSLNLAFCNPLSSPSSAAEHHPGRWCQSFLDRQGVSSWSSPVSHQ